MKSDVGVGFRAMVKGQIIRIDLAFSEEEVGARTSRLSLNLCLARAHLK